MALSSSKDIKTINVPMKDYIRLDSKLLISYFKSKFMIVLIYHAQ